MGAKHRSASAMSRLRDGFGHPVMWASLLFLIAAGIGFGAGAWQNLCADCPSIAQIHTWEPQQTSKVFSHDGRLLAELGIERRTPVSIHALPEHVPQAFLAIEDRRFYGHHGLDLRGVTRAAMGVLVSGSFRGGGGSTITQQLARNMFEAIGFERRGWAGIERKLKELQVALELERAYSKDQILEAYMNQVNFDRGWYGIQTASRNYFGKNADELNPAEAATLAAVVNRPAYYNPIRNPDNGLQRRNLVLDRMAREGFLTREGAEEWKRHPLPTGGALAVEGLAPYAVEWVRQDLQSLFGLQLYTAGLQVYTTLDVEMQRTAEIAMARGFARIEAEPGFSHPTYDAHMATGPGEETNTPYIQGTIVVIDPHSGAVRAMVGGRDFIHSKFDRARQARRQPGSAFKTFVYAAALDHGIPASHIISDNAVVLPQGPGLDDWAPRNFDGEFHGDMTLREAYRRSINTVAVKLAYNDVGLETVAQTAQRLGIRTEIPRFPSMAIGAADVIPLQMAEAYSAFATLGTRVRPFTILRVENAQGEVLWEAQPERTQVIDPLSARAMVSLMEDVVQRGTANAAVRIRAGLPLDIPAAGKTGTTNDATDLWFVGFTPTLQAAVWFGMDRPQRIYPNASSGHPAQVWAEFMRQVYVGDLFADEYSDNGEGSRPLLPRPEPWPLDGLVSREVDSRTGLLASQWCPADRRYVEYFIPGTEPTEPCDETAASGPLFRWPF